jgi:hypothetical protein
MEMNRIRKVVEESDIHTDSHDVTGVLEELIRQAKTEAEAAEYRRMLDLLPAIDAARERNRPESIKAWLKQREEDWADPWEAVEAATQERRRPLLLAEAKAVIAERIRRKEGGAIIENSSRKYAGCLQGKNIFKGDPVEIQRRMRDEWD